MELLPEISILFEILVAGIQESLPKNLVGVYLRGSLAMGDFIPQTSDVDVLAVPERMASEAEYANLVRLHNTISGLENRFAKRLEMAYIDRVALRKFQPGLRHPTLGQGEALQWSEHHENWILERWIVRHYGIPLIGPAPQPLIDPILPEEIRQAVRLRLSDWVDWAQTPTDPDWLLPRSHKVYVVETMCRALYTLATARLASKPNCVAWALQSLPEPWRTTVEHSQAWRADLTVDPVFAAEARDLILWTASQAKIAS